MRLSSASDMPLGGVGQSLDHCLPDSPFLFSPDFPCLTYLPSHLCITPSRGPSAWHLPCFLDTHENPIPDTSLTRLSDMTLCSAVALVHPQLRVPTNLCHISWAVLLLGLTARSLFFWIYSETLPEHSKWSTVSSGGSSFLTWTSAHTTPPDPSLRSSPSFSELTYSMQWHQGPL